MRWKWARKNGEDGDSGRTGVQLHCTKAMLHGGLHLVLTQRNISSYLPTDFTGGFVMGNPDILCSTWITADCSVNSKLNYGARI